jgi:hypothetical protein
LAENPHEDVLQKSGAIMLGRLAKGNGQSSSLI